MWYNVDHVEDANMTDDAAREAVVAMKAKHTLVYTTTYLNFVMLRFSDHKLRISTEYKIQNTKLVNSCNRRFNPWRTWSFPSLVPVMTYRPPGAKATDTPYPVAHVLRQECWRVDQILTPSLLHVAACNPSAERHTPRTSDLTGRREEGRREERRDEVRWAEERKRVGEDKIRRDKIWGKKRMEGEKKIKRRKELE